MTDLVIVILKMSKNIEPPSFISENKSFDTYKKDLERWAVLTTLPADKQALLVVHYLDGDPSGIKEKIDEAIEEDTLRSANGIKALIEFFEKIYKKDSLADGFDKYISFEKLRRGQNTSIQEFIPEWNAAYRKAVNIGCSLSDKVLAFKLLDASNLTNIERNLVLTGVNYKEKELLAQMEAALKKFVSRSTLSGEVEKSMDSTFLTSDNLEKVLLAKGWTKPNKKGKKRTHSPTQSLPEDARPVSKNYKGKKNPLGKDFKVLKCFTCGCDHSDPCECPCVFHMADKCPMKKKEGTADLGLFMKTNMPGLSELEDSDDEVAYFITEVLPLIPQPPHVQGPPDDPEVGGGPQRDRLPGDLHPLHNGAGSPQPSAIGNTRPRRNTRLPDRYTDADYDVSTLMLTDQNYYANFPVLL